MNIIKDITVKINNQTDKGFEIQVFTTSRLLERPQKIKIIIKKPKIQIKKGILVINNNKKNILKKTKNNSLLK